MKTINFNGLFGFWMFMIVYICIEAVMYMKGHDTYFWRHKTPIEIQLQEKELKNEMARCQ